MKKDPTREMLSRHMMISGQTARMAAGGHSATEIAEATEWSKKTGINSLKPIRSQEEYAALQDKRKMEARRRSFLGLVATTPWGVVNPVQTERKKLGGF